MQVQEKITVYENFVDKTTAVVNNFPVKLESLINNIIRKEGYKRYNVERKGISTNGGSYLGDLYEIDVKGETVDGPKETNIFIKNIPSNVDNLKILPIPKAYKKEIFAYNELNKVFNELQDEAGIPNEERFKMVKSFDESNSEAIILENITRKGFKTPSRFDLMTLNYAEKAMQQLARFHALSFVIKERRPNYFNDTLTTAETPLIFSEDWQGYLNSMCTLTLNCLDDDMRHKMEDIFPSLLNKCSRYIQEASKLGCLCHGDYRPNNIMTKEMNGDVIELIPIDYQLIHFGCPVQDIMYFMYIATDKAFRTKHFTHLKSVYHDAVGKFLDYFDINVKTAYPKEEFEKIFKERLDYCLIVTIIYGPFILADENDIPDLANDDMTNISFKVSETYKDRLRETIEELIDYIEDN